MIGLHVQAGIPGWLEAIRRQPAGVWNKSVDNLHTCRELKENNPDSFTVFRKEYNHHQSPGDSYEQKKENARIFFRTFIDGTFYDQELYRHIDAIEEWNEYLANSQLEDERGMWIEWCMAVNEVWTDEYRTDPRLAHIRLVSCNTAIGNDIDARFARIVQTHGGILGYHNYTEVHDKLVTDGDWRWLSGRWTTMDADYKAQGITVNWLMTEGGPFAGVYEGWRHPVTYHGDLQAHIDGQVKYQIDRCSAWNAAHGGRLLGQVLYTVGMTGAWDYYEYETSDMIAIADFVKAYSPEPTDPDPPPTDTPEQQIYNFAASITDANNDSALQLAMWADGWDIGGPEKWTTIDGVQYAVKPAVSKLYPDTLRAYYAVVPHWDNVRWTRGDDSTFILDIPHMSQRGIDAAARYNDCGAACAAMVINGQTTYTPTVNDIALTYQSPPNSYMSFAQIGAALWGYDMLGTHVRPFMPLDIEQEIIKGLPVIALVWYQSLPQTFDTFNGSHFIVIYGTYGDDGLLYHDPLAPGDVITIISFVTLELAMRDVVSGGNHANQGMTCERS